ncbi:MAG TPA: CHRD domain-containing protein [Usitatibacter sp.]|nr:CHRD domain-containing protein [Usitatibacter sp.]
MNDLRIHRLAAVATAAAVLAGCATVQGWMHREEPKAAAAPMGTGYTQQVTLKGANEVPPNVSTATGMGSVTVSSNHGVTVRITVSGMNATAAHIHMAPAGSEGPVIVPLTKSGDNTFVAPENAKLTDEQYEAFKAGRTYVNVHSAAHPGGEIRGQLKGG